MKLIAAALLTAICVGAVRPQTDSIIATYLESHSRAPVDYVLSRATSHRITVIGEAHWLRGDVFLVAALIPALHKANIDLAAELFPASEQSRIDELINGSKWDEQKANRIMRAAAWPYQEYRDLLHASWLANQAAEPRLKIVALGPPPNWRELLLPRGVTYDSFMADLVQKHTTQTRRRLVVYCGMHHAFTRYYMSELDNAGKTRAYMDRMGNILARQFGEQVFLIALHKPIWCGNPAQPSYCLPFGARIDCAGFKAGRPLAFDVVGSPLAEWQFETGDYYSYGHPNLRFVDYVDGYVWLAPIERVRLATVIPLEEYAPDETSRAQTAHENPFNDEVDVSRERLQEIWAREIEANRDAITKRGWKPLIGWQSRCRP